MKTPQIPLQWGICCNCNAPMNPNAKGNCPACIEAVHGKRPPTIGCPDCLGGQEPPRNGSKCDECNGTGQVNW